MDPEENARALASRLHQARLVLYFEELGLVAYWNGSMTFNVVGVDGTPADTFMTEYVPESPERAAEAIRHHLEGWAS